ncbi:MAG TPA: hypothetical protein VG015_08700 [Candidatus Dormibacteraeota bacterium]|jgi:hypothetical protein|nr:hypothetical protein [Candidatus Dormibacteraeota bacterium]
MRQDSVRTVLVVADKPYLWSALSHNLHSQLIRFRWTPAADLETNWHASRPWPWLIVGSGAQAGALTTLAHDLPVPVLWLGSAPVGVETADVHDSWEGLAADLRCRIGFNLGGLCFAPRRGVRTPQGVVAVDVPELEGLMAAPAGMRAFGRLGLVQRAIDRYHLPFEVRTEGGVVALYLPLEPRPLVVEAVDVVGTR